MLSLLIQVAQILKQTKGFVQLILKGNLLKKCSSFERRSKEEEEMLLWTGDSTVRDSKWNWAVQQRPASSRWAMRRGDSRRKYGPMPARPAPADIGVAVACTWVRPDLQLTRGFQPLPYGTCGRHGSMAEEDSSATVLAA